MNCPICGNELITVENAEGLRQYCTSLPSWEGIYSNEGHYMLHVTNKINYEDRVLDDYLISVLKHENITEIRKKHTAKILLKINKSLNLYNLDLDTIKKYILFS